MLEKPMVVYHVAEMGNWRDVVNQQLKLLRAVELHKDVRITFVGNNLVWLKDRCIVHGVQAEVVRHDPNVAHFETLAMLEIEKIAKTTDRPILYFHTKGVSNPGHSQKTDWRRVMEEWVIRRWRENLTHLKDHDAVGVSWWEHGEQHFSGNFWMANSNWIRRLPDFTAYHERKGYQRFSCEMWIGSAEWCKAYSLGCRNEILSWYPVGELMPPSYPKKFTAPVTVVIPTIPPRMSVLRRALESIENQTVQVESVIIEVDKNKEGAEINRNRALDKSKSLYTAFLDDDDEFYPDHVELLYNHAVKTDADLVFSFPQHLIGDEVPQEAPDWMRFGVPFDEVELRKGNYIPVTTLVKTELAKKARFKTSPGVPYEDWGFLLNMLDLGAKFEHLPERTWKYYNWGVGKPGLPGNTAGLADRW